MAKKLSIAEVVGELERQGYRKQKLPVPEMPGPGNYLTNCYTYTRNFHRILHHWFFVDSAKGITGTMVFWEENNLKRFLVKLENHIRRRWLKKPKPTETTNPNGGSTTDVDLIGEYLLSKKALADGKRCFLQSRKIDHDLVSFMDEYYSFINEFFVTPTVFSVDSDLWSQEAVTARNIETFVIGTPVVCIPGWRTAGKELRKLLSRLHNALMLSADIPRFNRRGRVIDPKTAELHEQVRHAYALLKENDLLRENPTSRQEKISLLAERFCLSPHTIHAILSRKAKMHKNRPTN